MIRLLAVGSLAGLLSGLLGGCGQARYTAAGPWQWSPPTRLAAGNAGSSSAVIAAPGRADSQFFAYANDQFPEFYRRDESMSIRSNDPSDRLMGWQQSPRPTLDRHRSFRTSKNAERYTYPSTRDDHRYRSNRRRR